MLSKIKNWFLGLAGVPALVDKITFLEKEREELIVALLAEKGFNVFSKESTLETKVRVGIRKGKISYKEAQAIIALLVAVPSPQSEFRISRAKPEEKPQPVKRVRKGLGSTGG